MRPRWCPTVLCLLLLTASSVLAEVRPLAEGVSVGLPVQWNAEQHGPSMWTLFSPDEACQVQFMTRQYVFPDAAVLARDRAGDFEAKNTLRILPEGQGYVFSASGSRFWFMESGGWTLTIAVSGPHQELANLLGSFSAKGSDLHAIFKTMGTTSSVFDWLTYAESASMGSLLPPVSNSVMPDFTRYGIARGENASPPPLAQELPKGWSHRAIGPWTVASTEDGRHWAAARVCSVAEADGALPEGAPLMETAKGIATGIGGRNLFSDGGVVYFTTPSGMAEVSCSSGGKALVSLYGDRRSLDDLFGFASLPGVE